MTNKVKIKVSIDSNSTRQMEVTSNFLKELSKIAEQESNGTLGQMLSTETTIGKTKIETEEKAEKKVVLEKKVVNGRVEIGMDTVETPTAETTFKIEDVRKALTEKVQGHRDAIKAELTKLGASNVTLLDPSKYEIFINFLTAL